MMENVIHNQVYITTLAYLEPWDIQNPRHIQNTAKPLSRNISFKTLSNPNIFKTVVYSDFWYILKSKHIQNPAEYLRRSILLRTLCNHSRFKRPIYSKLLHIQDRCVSATPYTFFLFTSNQVARLMKKKYDPGLCLDFLALDTIFN